MPWMIRLHPECAQWAWSLPEADQRQLILALDVLAEAGPALGRPLVDHIRHSRHRNLKELRPPSSGTSELRVLFAFDPAREAILLLGGDKSGKWDDWYEQMIPIADERFDAHLLSLGRLPESTRRERRKRR